jgi:hypothetical protein
MPEGDTIFRSARALSRALAGTAENSYGGEELWRAVADSRSACEE